ncbi:MULTISPECIES: radical SAM protein [Dehalococcoides]|jgi:pyruvate-formate lyase-activating enzyme|uniref:radical SAM protein n=1 Tax=Dehalococcoides TaxID=61434 RepID=UPI0002B768AA|nr:MULTISPECIES: radical SAM protein [Dehalococcoides]AGG07687.1 radical SAM domain-containing protein [Dehalococcoides mccartyi BTF08]AHB13331.1 radical SAM domain-containing protein [Dehalococcoides mccartyi GY50]AII57760.1 radical SAM protein [Dehalococcoides mccartyi CG1]AOV99217.1 radical SAM, pyruvate-formate lyase-activating enzyme like [Dehalococcoides mccartyi]APH12241.1 radical SAM protein [Dehalococcoides mccartyi]
MKVYHLAYEPSYHSMDFHFWTECNLKCRGCYTNYEVYDFGLLDDPVAEIITRERQAPPTKFLTFDQVMEKIDGYTIKYAVFLGTEAVLDPELPKLAKAVHEKYGSYNILLTNGIRMPDLTDIDQVIFSLKAYSEDIYRDYTSRSNKSALENLKKIHASLGERKLHVEVVYIPDYIAKDEIEKVAQFLASIDKDMSFRIDAYFPIPGCPWRAANKEEVEEAAEVARKYLNNVVVLTLDMKRIGDKAVKVF